MVGLKILTATAALYSTIQSQKKRVRPPAADLNTGLPS